LKRVDRPERAEFSIWSLEALLTLREAFFAGRCVSKYWSYILS